MTWRGIRGHDVIVERFRRSLTEGRLASSFLFVGPPGVGKRMFADHLAGVLLCQASPPEQMEPCGQCSDCQMVSAGSHPDLDVISKPVGKSAIPLELLIGDKEHRMQEGLCHRISLRPFRGGRKVAIIDDADHLNQEGANCLLKTLEEPPPNSVLILIGTSEQKQLPTIRSRCQILRFRPLPCDVLADLLLEQSLASSAEEAEQLARLGQGSIARALKWRDEELGQFRESLLEGLAQGVWNAPDLARTVAAFVEQAGKDAAPRRERMRLVIELTAHFHSQLMRRLVGADVAGDERLVAAIDGAVECWRGDAETAALCVDRCIEALSHVAANANQATLLDCWLDDLERIGWRGQHRQTA